MDRRRHEHITAVTLHVDAGRDLVVRARHRTAWPLEVHMPTRPRRYRLDARRQRAVDGLDLAQLGFGVEAVHVDDEYV